MALNDDILDAQVSHAIGLQRLGTGILRRILALLNRTDTDVENQIRQRLAGIEPGTVESDATIARLNELLDALRGIGDRIADEMQVRLIAETLGLAKYEIEYQAATIGDLAPVSLSLGKPSTEQLQAVVLKRPFQGRVLRDWARGIGTERTRRIADAIRIGMVEGENTDQIVKRVRGSRSMGFRDGVLEISRRDAEAVVRTAVTHVASGAAETFYKANADTLKGVKWVSVLDSRTTPVCQARDGKVYEVGKGPRPPAHFRCRSTCTPVVKSYRELGIDLDDLPGPARQSMDGQEPADTTYGKWLAKQSAATQDEILGPTKGLLFRRGGLSVDRFVDRSGHAYTLDELRRREGRAFRASGLAA